MAAKKRFVLSSFSIEEQKSWQEDFENKHYSRLFFRFQQLGAKLNSTNAFHLFQMDIRKGRKYIKHHFVQCNIGHA